MEVKHNHKEHIRQILSILAVGLFSVVYVFYYVDNTERVSLLQRAQTVAATLTVSEVSALSGQEDDLTNPNYVAIKSKLHNVVVANPDLRFAYITAKRGSQILFLVDSEDPTSRDYSPPGQIYEDASPEFLRAFDGGQAFVEGPVRDQWGLWISALVPISASDGTIVAIVGVDVGAYGYVVRLIVYSLIPVLLTLFLVFYAVSSRRLAEKERENIELRSQFIAIASHELRSPITGIKWALQSFVEGARTLDEKQTETIAGVLRNTERLLTNVNDILEFAALEKGAIKLVVKENKHVYEVLKEAAESLRFAAVEKQIVVTFASDWPVGADTVACDKLRLRMAFANVLSNAIKYSPEKTEITVSAQVSATDVTVAIRDVGIGIPAKEQENIFKEFFRSTNAIKSVQNGTGLGLYYTKAIVEAHGGTIRFESEEGKGTVFYVQLPRVVA